MSIVSHDAVVGAHASPATAPTLGAMLRAGAAATVVAAVTTPVVALAGRATGISLDVDGAPIPWSGFAVLTLVFAVVGLVIAAAQRRFARRPRAAWLRTTLTLTVLSTVPDLVVPAEGATKALLVLTHVTAAAIVIPTVARRLS